MLPGRRRQHHRRDAVPAGRRLGRAHHQLRAGARRCASTRRRRTPPPSSTTEGDIVIELDAANAPETVNNFVVLSRYHFYDNVPFHRIVPGFVNQAGDPVGPTPGTGGPGLHDPRRAAGRSGHGLPARHGGHGQQRRPESGGSQFFLVIGDAERRAQRRRLLQRVRQDRRGPGRLRGDQRPRRRRRAADQARRHHLGDDHRGVGEPDAPYGPCRARSPRTRFGPQVHRAPASWHATCALCAHRPMPGHAESMALTGHLSLVTHGLAPLREGR